MENVAAEKDTSGRQIGGLTAEQVEAIKRIVWGVPDSQEDLIPGRLATTGEPVLIAAEPGERIGPAMASFASSPLLFRSGSGWRSRKLWVVLATLGGMMAQLPMDKSLPPVAQIVIGTLVGIYLFVQGREDHTRAKAECGPLPPVLPV